jgi:hypothetical protein
MWLLFHRNSFCSQISVELLCVFLEQFILGVLVSSFLFIIIIIIIIIIVIVYFLGYPLNN